MHSVIWKIILLIVTNCAVNTFAQDISTTTSNPIGAGYQVYAKDGLSLRHPPHWILKYDEAPDLFANRGVSFNVSEISHVDVLVFQERDIGVDDVVTYFEKSMNFDSALYRNYQKTPLQLGRFNGISMRWSNTFLVAYQVELSILQVMGPPNGVFVVINFDEKSQSNESVHIIPFIESIQVQ